MVDLHTHILCGMDDGAQNPETSLQMLRMEKDQGVDTVVLTPHFYRYRERASDFLHRRTAAMERLQDYLQQEAVGGLPNLVVGAEVAWVPNLADCSELDQLCLGETKYMLLELPFSKWDASLTNQIYSLMGRTGITPVIAHLERYLKVQQPEQIREILSLELPVQISSTPLLRLMSRGGSLKALRNWAHVVASDCHDTTCRPPNLAGAMEVIRRKLGPETAEVIDRNAGRLLWET